MKRRFYRYKNVKMAKKCVYDSCTREGRYSHSHTISMGEFPFLPIPIPYQEIYYNKNVNHSLVEEPKKFRICLIRLECSWFRYLKIMKDESDIYHQVVSAQLEPGSGGSRIWQGRVSSPSERGTRDGKAPDIRAEGARRRAPAGGLGASPRKFENLDTLLFIFPAFQGIQGTQSVWLSVLLWQKGHPKQRAGVRTPWTPPLDPPLPGQTNWPVTRSDPAVSDPVTRDQVLVLILGIYTSRRMLNYATLQCSRQWELIPTGMRVIPFPWRLFPISIKIPMIDLIFVPFPWYSHSHWVRIPFPWTSVVQIADFSDLCRISQWRFKLPSAFQGAGSQQPSRQTHFGVFWREKHSARHKKHARNFYSPTNGNSRKTDITLYHQVVSAWFLFCKNLSSMGAWTLWQIIQSA